MDVPSTSGVRLRSPSPASSISSKSHISSSTTEIYDHDLSSDDEIEPTEAPSSSWIEVGEDDVEPEHPAFTPASFPSHTPQM